MEKSRDRSASRDAGYVGRCGKRRAWKTLEERGMEVNVLSAEEKAAFQASNQDRHMKANMRPTAKKLVDSDRKTSS